MSVFDAGEGLGSSDLASDVPSPVKGRCVMVETFEAALQLVVDHMISMLSEGLSAVLIGSTKHMVAGQYADQWADVIPRRSKKSETPCMMMFKELIQRGTRKRLSLRSTDDYVRYVRKSFSRVILPYEVAPHDIVVFEVVFKEAKGAPYLKVWDPFDRWSDKPYHEVDEILHVLSLFFDVTEQPRVSHRLFDGSPRLSDHLSSVPVAFFTIVNLVMGRMPPHATEHDGGCLRNYMWGCICQNKMLPVPRRKFSF